MMALKVLHSIVYNIQAAPFVTIMVDETTDVANKEERWVDDN